MAHAIDTTTGKAAVFVTGAAAWHRLGKVVAQAQTSAEAISLAGLDWIVKQYPAVAQLNDGTNINPDRTFNLRPTDRVANVRMDTLAVLGVVGKGYHVFQNAAAFDFMDAIVSEKLAMYETAGAIFGGRRVWLMARIPQELRVAGTDDVTLPYVLLTNSHDGSTALRMIPTSVRVVCQNTLNLALRRAGTAGLTIRHCESLAARVEDARANLGIITKRVSAFQAELDALAAVSLKETEVADYFRGVFKMRPPLKKAAAHTDGASLLESLLGRAVQQSEVMADLLEGHREQTARKAANDARLLEQLLSNYHNDTNSLPGVEGTVWAAYNAVSE